MSAVLQIAVFEPLAFGRQVPIAHRQPFPYPWWLVWHWQNTLPDHRTFPAMLVLSPFPSLA